MKMRLLVTVAGFAIGFVLPVLAQEQIMVDPEVRQQIEAVLKMREEAINKNDAAAVAALTLNTRLRFGPGSRKVDWLPVSKPLRNGTQPSSHQVPANSSTSLLGCVQPATRCALSPKGVGDYGRVTM